MTYPRAVVLMVGVVAIVGLGGLLAAVGTGLTPATTATALCHEAFRSGRDRWGPINSAPTTVEGVRSFAIGPERPMYGHAFPYAKPDATVGWCWVGTRHAYKLSAVVAGRNGRPSALYVEGLLGRYFDAPPPPGPVAVP